LKRRIFEIGLLNGMINCDRIVEHFLLDLKKFKTKPTRFR
jgi:hypothetical protein